MIKKEEFKQGKRVIYRDGLENYAVIELIEIKRIKKPWFFFTARIVDNSNVSNSSKENMPIGSIHSFSNCFIHESPQTMTADNDRYINNQVKLLTAWINTKPI